VQPNKTARLPEESKNVIHKNKANVSDPQTFVHQKIYITYPRCIMCTQNEADKSIMVEV
jgi:hypothetical protein